MDASANWLGFIANVAAIWTAVVAFVGSVVYILERCGKQRRLEAYLKTECDAGTDKGQRAILHCVAEVGAAQDEILQVIFRRRHIGRVRTSGKRDDMANDIPPEYGD